MCNERETSGWFIHGAEIANKNTEFVGSNKEEQISCVKGKFTVCVGDTEKFGVPTCYDFPLDKYTYKRYDDHLVVINKEVSTDVVNYPNKQLISAAKSGCKD